MKVKQYISIAIILLLQFSIVFASEGVDLSTMREAKADTDALALATVEAYNDAAKAYLAGEENDYTETIPDYDYLEEKYDLDDEQYLYAAEFKKTFLETYKTVYEDTYTTLKTEKNMSSLDSDLYDLAKSEALGYSSMDASRYAAQEVYQDLRLDSTRNLISEKDLITLYHLNDYPNEYVDIFLATYKKNYKETYNASYILNKKESYSYEYGTSFSDGYSLGYLEGVMGASIHYLDNLPSMWEISYKMFIKNEDLDSRYSLNRMSEKYKTTFKSGVQKGYKEAYLITFQNASLRDNVSDENYIYLNASENNLTHSSDISIVKEGSITTQKMESVEVKIEEGTVYSPLSYLGLSKGNMDVRNGFITSYYDLNLKNTREVYLEKPITFSFYVPGNYSLGCYRYEKDQWVYVNTEYNKDTISTKIPSGLFTNARVALKKKPTSLNFNPTNSLHWAYPEYKLNSIRGYINEDFDLDAYLIRSEFVKLLYKNINGERVLNSDWNINYTDVSNDSETAYFINYLETHNFIYNYGDLTTFLPDGFISYNEFKLALDRITGNNITWETLSKNLSNERYVQMNKDSNGTDPITKGEALYLIEQYKGAHLFLGRD